MYLIYDIESKRVLNISEVKPTEISGTNECVYSDKFVEGDELENAIHVNGYYEDNGEKVLDSYSAYKISIPVKEVLNKNRELKSEIEDLKMLVADLALNAGGSL